MKKNKFQMKKEETYKHLIEKGYFVLLKKGFSKTNIADIAEAAGYTRGAFYFHFESKEDYFIHVMKYHDEKRGDEWSNLPYQYNPEVTPLKEVLKQSVSSLWENVYEDTKSGWLLVGIDFYQSAKDDPSIKPQLKEIHKNWEDDVAQYVRALQDQGYVPSSINPEEAALQFIMATYGYMVTFYMYDKKDFNILLNFYLKIFS